MSYYYKILVADNTLRSSEYLTYSSNIKIAPLKLVEITLKNKSRLGIVVETTQKPAFSTKPIVRIVDLPVIPRNTVSAARWLSEYYAAPLPVVLALFLPGFVMSDTYHEPEVINDIRAEKLPELTKNQKNALEIINNASAGTFILHGDTGSGKTRVYQELAEKSLNESRSALILTPEIGLTPQIYETLAQSFKGKVMVYHSDLPEKQRRTVWRAVISSDEPFIIIGTRSALLLPFKNLGLVVADEMHDSSYKNQMSPQYDAKRLAGKLAELYKAKLILGSATPTINDYYIARAKQLPIIRMQGNAAFSGDPNLEIIKVSSRDRTKFTKHPNLSDELIESIQIALSNNEQSLVFLNRRGSARVIICGKCGWQALCPNCDLPLTYHEDKHSVICHTCGYSTKAPTSCPECDNTEIIYKSIGTKALISALQKFFPGANISRFDADSGKSEKIEANYEDIASGKIDILVGTQILTKGLDLPKLSVVGIVSADTSLNFPDFTADERTFQLISQVSGRVGRGHRAGKVIIQTQHPDSIAINCAIENDWDKFYDRELAARQEHMFPPFCYLLKLTTSKKTDAAARKSAEKQYSEIIAMGLSVAVIGPSPSFHVKKSGNYIWQIVVKSKNREHLLKIAGAIKSGWTQELDPIDLI